MTETFYVLLRRRKKYIDGMSIFIGRFPSAAAANMAVKGLKRFDDDTYSYSWHEAPLGVCISNRCCLANMTCWRLSRATMSLSTVGVWPVFVCFCFPLNKHRETMGRAVGLGWGRTGTYLPYSFGCISPPNLA